MSLKTTLATALLSTLAMQAHAFGPFGAMIQNQIQSSVQNAVGQATDAAINAGVNAAVNGAVAAATSGTAVTPEQANQAAGTATAAAQYATSQQGQAAAHALTNGTLTGGGKAWVLGNIAAGMAANAVQNAASGNNAQTAGAGVTYTLTGANTDTSVAANALQQGIGQCAGNTTCIKCVTDAFGVQMNGIKPGTHTLGAGCFGTAAVAPAAGN